MCLVVVCRAPHHVLLFIDLKLAVSLQTRCSLVFAKPHGLSISFSFQLIFVCCFYVVHLIAYADADRSSSAVLPPGTRSIIPLSLSSSSVTSYPIFTFKRWSYYTILLLKWPGLVQLGMQCAGGDKQVIQTELSCVPYLVISNLKNSKGVCFFSSYFIARCCGGGGGLDYLDESKPFKHSISREREKKKEKELVLLYDYLFSNPSGLSLSFDSRCQTRDPHKVSLSLSSL